MNELGTGDFIRRACAGRRTEPARMLRPSLFYRLLRDPWGVSQDYHGPAEERVDLPTRYDRLRMEAGERFEREWTERRYPDAVRIPGWKMEDLQATIEAMRRGAPAIHHPQLWALGEDVYGQGDVLVRSNDHPSDLGPFHYRVKECKRSSRVQDYHRLQAALYNRILGLIQGYTPASFEVVLPFSEETVAAAEVAETVEQQLAAWRSIRDGSLRPELPGYGRSEPPWRAYADKQLAARGDVTLMAGFTVEVRAKLRAAFGVDTIEGTAGLSEGQVREALGPEIGERLYWQARAYRERKALPLPGATRSIPRRSRTIYWDFETSAGFHPGEPAHAYMIGTLENGHYRAFIARGAGEEERMFRDFLAFVGDPSQAHLYQWTKFEIRTLEAAAKRHPSLAGRLGEIAAACVDLHALTKSVVVLPVPSYSLKQVAPAFADFHWRQGKEVDGNESMVLYWEWLEDGALEPIEKVLVYNEDDVRALEAVDRTLARFTIRS